MDNSFNCDGVILPYRVVQTLTERNSIPCTERINGMIVTVVGKDKSYKQYMLKGGDPCVNSNWKDLFDLETVLDSIGHVTTYEEVKEYISDEYLNTRFPKAKEGFRVTFTELNTTFTKTHGEVWGITNNKIN